MLTLRCTKKILDRFDAEPEENPPSSTTLLGDWYVKPVSLPYPGRSVVIFVSAKAFPTVILEGRGRKDMPALFRERMLDLLQRLDLPTGLAEHERAESEKMTIARTASRSVLGTMNEIERGIRAHCEYHDLRYEEISWSELEEKESETLHNPKQFDTYRRPIDVAREIWEASEES